MLNFELYLIFDNYFLYCFILSISYYWSKLILDTKLRFYK